MTIKCFDKLPDEAVKIRTLVFVEEQGFKNEFDSIDEIATHIVMFDGDNPVAVGRFFPSENSGSRPSMSPVKRMSLIVYFLPSSIIFIKSRAMCRWVKPILMSIAHTLR